MENMRYSAPDALAGLMLQHGLGDWVGAVQEHKLDLEALATMQAADLREVIGPLGARMKLLKAVRGGPQPSATPPPAPGGDRYADTTHQRREAFEHEEWEEEEGGRPPLGNVGMPARAHHHHHHHHPGGSGRAACRHPEPRPEEEPPLLYDPYYGPEQGRPPAASHHHHHHNHPRRIRHKSSEKRGGAAEKPRKNTPPQSSQANPTPPQTAPTTTSEPEPKAAKNLRYTPIPTATPAQPAGSPPNQVVDLSTTTSSDSPPRPPTPISPKSGGESAELSDQDDGTPHTLFVGGLPRNEDGSPTEFELSDILPPKALRAVRSVTKKAGFAFINVNSDKLLDQLINQRPPTYMGRRIVFKHSHRNVDANSGPSNPRREREGGDASCRSANFPPPKGDSNCRVCILGEPGGLSEENNVRALIGTHLASKLTRVETGKDGRGMECVILTFATRMAADRALDMDGIEYMGRSLILIPESQMTHGEPAELSEPTLEEPEALPPPPHTTQPPPRRGSTSDAGSGSDGQEMPAEPEPVAEPEAQQETCPDPEEPEQVVDRPEEKVNTPPSETPKMSWDGGIGDLW